MFQLRHLNRRDSPVVPAAAKGVATEDGDMGHPTEALEVIRN